MFLRNITILEPNKGKTLNLLKIPGNKVVKNIMSARDPKEPLKIEIKLKAAGK